MVAMKKICDYFVKSNKSFIIEYREFIDSEWQSTKNGHIYTLSKIYLDNPYWSEWKDYEKWKSAKLCRQRINKLNEQWSGTKEYRLKS